MTSTDSRRPGSAGHSPFPPLPAPASLQSPSRLKPARPALAGWTVAIALIAAVGLALTALTGWDSIAAAGAGAVQALPLLPALMALHLLQLLLSSIAWRSLFAPPRPGIAAFYQLRVMREGIDSLLPVAQVGGSIVNARLLSQRGIAGSQAGASVIVDLTVELLTQVVLLLAALVLLAWVLQESAWAAWLGGLLAGAGALAALLAAQRFGALRALERLLRGMAERFPGLAMGSLDGLHAAALALYRQPAAMLRCIGLHLVSSALGTAETWAVLQALGVPVTPAQAFVIESLGMAARSAGFAIPAALGAQEGGFVLAAAAVGVPAGPALALSLVKRARESVVGLIGLALWRRAASR